MNSFHRIAATAVASSALLLSTGVAAHAQVVTIKDKASDVVLYTSEDPDDNGTQLNYQESLDSGTDIRSMRVKHSKKSVSIRLTFADLDRDASITVAFKVPGKSEPQWFLTNVEGSKAELFNAKDKSVCAVPLTIEPGAKGIITAVVKRSCLGSPKKLKVAAATHTLKMSGTTYSAKQDAVSATNIRTPSYTKWLKAS